MSVVVRPLWKSESQPVLVPAGSTGGKQIYFPDNQYIRNKKLMAINLTTNLNEFINGAPAQKYIDGTLVASYQFASPVYLTLESYAGVQFVRNKPVSEFAAHNFQGTGITIADSFIGQKVNWPKCYITLANGIAATTADQYVLFDIHFMELTKKKNDIELGTSFGKMR